MVFIVTILSILILYLFLIKRFKNLFIVPKARQKQHETDFVIFYLKITKLATPLGGAFLIKRNRFIKK